MKTIKLSFLIILSSMMFIQCTSDPIPGPAGADGINGVDGKDGKDGVSTGAATSTTELLANKVFLGPNVDGVIDASWADSQILVATTVVPDPGNNVFRGYVGQSIDAQIRAQYDSEFIYFLAEWKDSEETNSRDTWYFDPTTNRWAQESNKPVFDGAGNIIRDAFYEDKFAMQWNISEVASAWDTQTCYATCHTNDTEAEGFAHHYTSAAGLQTDMWHFKSIRLGKPVGQFDDKHIVFPDATHPIAGGKTRAGDAKVSGSHSNNVITLPLLDGANAGTNVKVPKYYIPGRSDYYWILKSEIDNGTAVAITGVHDNGMLELAGGGTIDPNTDLDFQRPAPLNANDIHSTAKKGMPSIFTAPIVGSRGDILCAQTYTGTGWILEYKRKLVTGNSDDVAFDTTKNYPFGFAIFNNAAIAHAIKPFLSLKFKQ
ncbi:MAG: hypothetical protein COZ76_05450 [Flavobacteriales bacterium CG_4_8_14_3_um_filter_35_10]|nr:MAG: hypothetical protein COZ76_05450 [Flavobacteriales bacterium CG_4_8_14_3_um_filter_35_10]